MSQNKPKLDHKLAAENRKARHQYFIEDSLEAGIMLQGSEVKSLREGKANIAESYASVEDGELWLINSYIPEFSQAKAAAFSHDARRRRKLLVHRRELARLHQAVGREGMTMVPLKLYFDARGRAKLEIGLAKGKKLSDKRDTEKKRDWEREKSRLLRDR
ncbi:SsrA-binding protein SmpB [Paralimibaculum aggregatum]|uniref:SsrA-binding protein n=1 Tax=Paralimibaculum aggregatum TaxID=3036245 RepID=A0ABQ6LRS6_9RHOB|nr:SsrA-binding protein SmpB [Limibaculum sp. NKW23]GMG84329.1 SsrA-binding protein SmpB [Limibaculum sp. NKW23]